MCRSASFVLVGLVSLATAAYESTDLKQPNSDWQKFIRERHRAPAVSPKKLKERFANKQKQMVKVKAAKEAYLHSEAHHLDMVRRGNKAAEEVRHGEYSLARQKKPGKGVQCGDVLTADDLGLKNTELVRQIFRPHMPSFLQHKAKISRGGPSLAQPKAGSGQELKDEGRSTMGTIASAEDDEVLEPYYKVFKDGFSFAICAKDDMYDYGDKYGDNKDQYKVTFNTSIVKYKEIVLEEKQVPMTPKVCYEFCRSVPDMVYFGIRGGNDCYCTPFYIKAESGSETCDLHCPGASNPLVMCGGKAKSQLFEMHLCADTAGDLLYMSVWAEVALVYFYDTAFMTDKLAHHLQETGELLQDIAGQAGDPVASDLAQEAKKEAGSLFDPTTGWGVCKHDYIKLLEIYNSAEPLYDADFTFAKEVQAAEDVIAMEDFLRKKLVKCAKEAEDPILAVFPYYFEFMASLDEKDLQARNDKHADGLVGFYPVTYYMDSTSTPEHSTCKAFQFFQIMDGGKQRPVCFLYSDVQEVRTYRCDNFLNSMLDFQQVKTEVGRSLRGNSSAPVTKLDLCTKVRQAKLFSGISCQSIWGKESGLIEKCPEECDETAGPKYSAVCMARVSLAKPKVKVKEYKRCFGNGNSEIEQGSADFRIQEFGTDASGGAGPLIEGEIEMGGEVVEEPYGHVWTPGPAGQR